MAPVHIIVFLAGCLQHSAVTAFIFPSGTPWDMEDLKTRVMYSWKSLDYDWPSALTRQQYVQSGKFQVQNNIITGIKVYRESVYITVPRWRAGVPSTLNKVVEKTEGPVLQPYPSWELQQEGNCTALQYVQSMEIDPVTGYMWIIDVGRSNIFEDTPLNSCPAKLVIWDINNDREVERYEFPESVVPRTSNFLNDIVLDRINGVASLAYISDARSSSLVVFDRRNRSSYRVKNWSMSAEPGSTTIRVGNTTLNNTTPIDGVAMSHDFRFLYYCALAAKTLFRVPTSVLRNGGVGFNRSLQRLGEKPSMTDGMICGKENLYFGALELDAVYWFRLEDTAHDASRSLSQAQILTRGPTKQWIDTLAFDGRGNIWFTANKLQDFLTGKMNFVDPPTPNMYVWKVYVADTGYLDEHESLTVSTMLPSIFPFG